jgi:hypothetical protein
MASTTSNSDDDEIPEYTAEEMNLPDPRKGVVEPLVPLEEQMYKDWRLDFARWAFDRGKDPYFGDGYSFKAMPNIMHRVEAFVEWTHSREGFTTSFSEAHVEAYWDTLRVNDNKVDTNRRTINCVSLVLEEQGVEWDIPKSKTVYKKISKETASNFTDYYSSRELDKIRSASLRAYGIPRREDMEPGEQDEWAAHLAQRLQKPKGQLTDEDWANANSWKIPSLVYVSRDVGFRPTEVEESRMSWLVIDDDDDEDGSLKIPKDEDSKSGKNNWKPLLSRETTRILRLWEEEREQDPMYKDRDEIWLTREGNPYTADSLRDVNEKLMQEAGIDASNRSKGWYMLRRGVGTEIGNSRGVLAVMSQLRINNFETARRYVKSDEDSIREWFDTR